MFKVKLCIKNAQLKNLNSNKMIKKYKCRLKRVSIYRFDPKTNRISTLHMNSDSRETRTGSAPPASVSLTSSFCLTPRRLSSYFIPSTEPVRAERQLSLNSTRLEKSSSAKQINHGSAWELFGPVVLVHAASAHLEKNKLISELQESVQLRVCFTHVFL